MPDQVGHLEVHIGVQEWRNERRDVWTPAFAGVTEERLGWRRKGWGDGGKAG